MLLFPLCFVQTVDASAILVKKKLIDLLWFQKPVRLIDHAPLQFFSRCAPYLFYHGSISPSMYQEPPIDKDFPRHPHQTASSMRRIHYREYAQRIVEAVRTMVQDIRAEKSLPSSFFAAQEIVQKTGNGRG
jgi:hypothetical protein